jgi:hypothetical protein
MSVFDSQCCGGIQRVLGGHADFGVAAVTAGQLRSAGLVIKRTGIGGPGHCEVEGKKTTGIKRQIAKLSEWVIEPPPQD